MSVLPMQGTDVAARWDTFYWALFGMSFVFFAGIIIAMIYFAVVYRRREGHQSSYIEGNLGLEILWTAVPTVLILIIFAWGWSVYKDLSHAPAGAYEIRVVGKQWNWQFIYNNGRSFTGEFYVPINRPVKLIMTSEDVIHSLFIPNFRIKKDVVPGLYTTAWFEATVPGDHQVYCAEYCGTVHSGMLAKIHVLDAENWDRFLKGN